MQIIFKNSEEYYSISGLIRALFRIPFSIDIEAIQISDKEVKIKNNREWVSYSRVGVS
jgi:hypothetical protein